jgi:hypothetical protein
MNQTTYALEMGIFAFSVVVSAVANLMLTGSPAVGGAEIPHDQILVLWCLLGASAGAFCSIAFFPVNTKVEAAMQLGVNFVLALTFSPLAVELVATWTGIDPTLRLTLPIATVIGIAGQQTVAMLIPYGRQWLAKRAQDAVDDHEIFGVLLIIDGDLTTRVIAQRASRKFAEENHLKIVPRSTIEAAEKYVIDAKYAILDFNLKDVDEKTVKTWLAQFDCPVIVLREDGELPSFVDTKNIVFVAKDIDLLENIADKLEQFKATN